MRLASNLLLTRLLAPEHFGLMAIVTVFMIGLVMFSDIGIGPNIIQSPRSQEPGFLNTAWTMQLMRSWVLWLACLVAGFPMALFYNEPQLVWLIPGAGIATLITGLNSTNIFTNNRDLKLMRMTLIEVASQLVAFGAMVAIGLIYPSVWVLIWGSIVSAFVKMVASHWFLPGIKNRWHWDAGTMKELLNFGQWIFLSTLLGFASSSMGSLIMGKLVSMKEVGLFSIAATLAKAVEQVYEQISQKVLLPIYAQIKSLPHDEVKRKVRKIRLGVMALFLPMLWVLILFGDDLIHVLFDNRYQGSAWILRVFALGLIPTIISGIGPFYLALGNSKLMMKMSGIKLVSYILCMLVGWSVAGSSGVIVGMSCFTFLVYFADSFVQHRYRVWIPSLDFLGYASSAVVLGSFFLLWGLR